MFGAVDLVFTRVDNVHVNYRITLFDIFNRDENFVILKVTGLESPLERRLFYQFDNRNWTLNEFIYFAENNDLCISIYDSNQVLVASYGACQTIIDNRLFGLSFNTIFN